MVAPKNKRASTFNFPASFKPWTWPGLVINLRDDEHDGVDGSIRMKVQAFDANLFEQSIQMRG